MNAQEGYEWTLENIDELIAEWHEFNKILKQY